MSKRKFWILAVVLLVLIPASTVYASKPKEIHGYFDQFVPGELGGAPTVYCIHTGENYGVPDGFMTGCVVQPVKPGLAEHGTFTGTVGGKIGTCEYNLRTFDLDGIARIVMNRCTDGLEGFHMKGTGWPTGFWEGTYHFE